MTLIVVSMTGIVANLVENVGEPLLATPLLS